MSIDWQKAFDNVDHNIASQIFPYGIRGIRDPIPFEEQTL